jgi:tetratricopeptide (TPR) repeat protein
VGSCQEQIFSYKYIDTELKKESVQSSVDYLNFHSGLDVLSCYIGDGNDIKRYLNEFYINSDYSPYVEFDIGQRRFSRHKAFLTQKSLFTQFIEKVRSRSVINHIDWTEFSQDEQERWRRRYELIYNVSTYVLDSYFADDDLSQLQEIYDGLKLVPEHAALLELEIRCLFSMKSTVNAKAVDEIIREVNSVLRKQPHLGSAWLMKSWALQYKNDISRALSAAQKAVQYAPYSVHAQNNMGDIFMNLGQREQAIAYYRAALRLKPTDAVLHNKTGKVLSLHGKFDEAITHFNEALRIKPGLADAYKNLGTVFVQRGRSDEAVTCFVKALKFKADWVIPMNNLAWILATHKDAKFYNPKESLRLAQRACELTGHKKPVLLDTLSVAYAAAGKYSEAIEAAEKAIGLAVSTGQKELAEDIQRHLELYQKGLPYREGQE